MIKRYYLLMLALVSAVIVSADPITKGSALQIARQFMRQQGKSVKGEPARAPRMQSGSIAMEEAAAYYVFNSSDGEGFVIVSGDDRTEQVLGYSMNGAFDEDSMPDNLKEWLQGYAEQIELIAAGKAVSAKVPIHSAGIDTRMTTTWNQGSPYNNMCVFNNAACATGCTATAVAQVMNWNQWPQSATTAIPGYTTRTYQYVLDELPSTTFEWGNMADDYESSATDNNQQEAVATLMRYVGQSVEMDYGPSSGAGFGKVIYALTHYFDYAPDITYEKASSYTIVQWDEKIYGELQQRPVVYEGYSTGGGHAFVLDGYDSDNGMYYVNWGWGGGSDGWYRLRLMDASGTGIGGSSTSDGYANNQGAIFGMRPADGSADTSDRYLHGQQSLFVEYSESAPCGMMGTYYYNPYCDTLRFDRGNAMLDDDGSIRAVFDEATYDTGNYGYYRTGYFPDPNYGMEAGNTYKFTFVSREEGATEWHKAFPDNKYFEVRFTSYDDYEIIVHPLKELWELTTIVLGENRINSTSTFNVDLFNSGEDFDDTMYILAKVPGSEEYAVIGRSGVAIESGEVGGISFPFTPQESGLYSLRLAYDSEGTQVVAETSVVIQKAKFDAIGLTYGYDGDNLNIEFENNNDVTYPYYLIIQLYNVTNGRLNFISQYDSEYSYANFIESNTSKIIPFAVGSLSPGDYCARIWYNPEFTQEWNMARLKDFYFTVDDEGKATVDIKNITSLTPSPSPKGEGCVYDLSGRKVADNYASGIRHYAFPKGIYIIDGKKVVIK